MNTETPFDVDNCLEQSRRELWDYIRDLPYVTERNKMTEGLGLFIREQKSKKASLLKHGRFESEMKSFLIHALGNLYPKDSAGKKAKRLTIEEEQTINRGKVFSLKIQLLTYLKDCLEKKLELESALEDIKLAISRAGGPTFYCDHFDIDNKYAALVLDEEILSCGGITDLFQVVDTLYLEAKTSIYTELFLSLKSLGLTEGSRVRQVEYEQAIEISKGNFIEVIEQFDAEHAGNQLGESGFFDLTNELTGWLQFKNKTKHDEFTYSSGYQTVIWKGFIFHFSKKAASIIKLLHRHHLDHDGLGMKGQEIEHGLNLKERPERVFQKQIKNKWVDGNALLREFVIIEKLTDQNPAPNYFRLNLKDSKSLKPNP